MMNDDVHASFKTIYLMSIIELRVVSDTLPPEVKRQVDLIESMIKSRVAIGSQISRSRVMTTLRNNVGVGGNELLLTFSPRSRWNLAY